MAQGIVTAYKNIGHMPVPLIVRLQGTHAQERSKIIENSRLKISAAIVLEDTAVQVKQALKH